MSRRIKLLYKMAKKDNVFVEKYNKQFPKDGDGIKFSWLDSSIDKAIIAAIYVGYLVGANRQETIDKLINE